MILVSHQMVFSALGVAERTQESMRSVNVLFSAILLNNCHLVDEACTAGIFVDEEQNVTDVDADVLANRRVVDEVAHRAFPCAVEVQAEQLTFSIENRATAVAASGVVASDESDMHCAVFVGIATEVFLIVELV